MSTHTRTRTPRDSFDADSCYLTYCLPFASRTNLDRRENTAMVNTTDSTPEDQAASEQLAARPAQLPTHPDEVANLPAPHIVPDGVSAPIRHPLDPLNAGKHPNEPEREKGIGTFLPFDRRVPHVA